MRKRRMRGVERGEESPTVPERSPVASASWSWCVLSQAAAQRLGVSRTVHAKKRCDINIWSF